MVLNFKIKYLGINNPGGILFPLFPPFQRQVIPGFMGGIGDSPGEQIIQVIVENPFHPFHVCTGSKILAAGLNKPLFSAYVCDLLVFVCSKILAKSLEWITHESHKRVNIYTTLTPHIYFASYILPPIMFD